MEIIRKKICIDDYVSRNSGLMPYVQFDGDNGNIRDVFAGTDDGNYGQFVCDFLFTDAEKRKDPFGRDEAKVFGLSINDEEFDEELPHPPLKYSLANGNRLRYLDIMRGYHAIKKGIENGIFLRRFHDTEWANCELQSVNDVKWLVNHDDKILYSYTILNSSKFFTNEKGEYFTKEPINNYPYIILVDNYEEIYTFFRDCFVAFWCDDEGNLDNEKTSYLYSVIGANNFPKTLMKFVEFVDVYLLGKYIVKNASNEYIGGARVPKYVYAHNFMEYKEFMNNFPLGKRGMKELWEEYGGYEFKAFLEGISPSWISSTKGIKEGQNFILATPVIDIPIAIEQEITQEFQYFPYEYTYDKVEETIVDYVKPESENGEGKSDPEENTSVTAKTESKLDLLFSKKAIRFSDEIFGIPDEYKDGKMFTLTYSDGVWTSREVASETRCVDGIGDLPEGGYHNIPFTACVMSLSDKAVNGKSYCFRAKYEVSEEHPIKIPYRQNEKLNSVYDNESNEEMYDEITSLRKRNTEEFGIPMYDIEYTVGKIEGVNSGIKYEELIPYSIKKETVTVDNFYRNVPVFYECLDYEAVEEKIYSEDYNLYRKGRKADISYKGKSESPDSGVMFFTKESMNGLENTPKYSISLSFDRGNASAWESHFKLSECNTLEDLVNYGNNYFNLEEQ